LVVWAQMSDTFQFKRVDLLSATNLPYFARFKIN
jgi:hypothetical protein